MRTTYLILMLSVTLTALPVALPQSSSYEPVPKVVRHADPAYPPLARQTRIQGEVRVKITTDGESVREAVAETGHPLLRKAAEENAKTWTFASHTPASFDLTFRYKLIEGSTEIVFLESPNIIEILATPPEMSIYYAGLGLGAWKTQIKGRQGKLSRVLELSYTGPDGDWLDVSTMNSKGESEHSDFGHIDGDFLAFTITLAQSGGQPARMFLVGRRLGNKIAGTFVDAAGASGTWTAVRTTDGTYAR